MPIWDKTALKIGVCCIKREIIGDAGVCVLNLCIAGKPEMIRKLCHHIDLIACLVGLLGVHGLYDGDFVPFRRSSKDRRGSDDQKNRHTRQENAFFHDTQHGECPFLYAHTFLSTY